MDLLAGYWRQMSRRDVPVYSGDVVDAGSPSVSVDGV